MDLSEAMDLLSSQVRLEAKLETLAESLEEKKKEYSIKEFEVSLKKKKQSDPIIHETSSSFR